MKNSFPNPINYNELSDFFLKGFGENLTRLFEEFAIPDTTKKEPKQFALALAQQFELFTKSEVDNIDNRVVLLYTNLLNDSEVLHQGMNQPYYNNDGVTVFPFNRSHTLNCYELTEHTWTFENSGKTDWIDRVLFLENNEKISPHYFKTTIPIPNTSPGQSASITVTIDARGQEGIFDCHWTMVDSDGNNCFLNNKTLFDVRLIVKFNS